MRQFLTQVFRRIKFQTRLIVAIALMVLATQLMAAPVNATGVYQIPNLAAGDRNWILDKAEILSRLTEGQINTELDKLANETGNQVRFVTIRHLDYGETVESFTNQLFEKWFPTPEAQANQILLVIDSVTNNTAIRTGEKVKSILSDDIANSIAEETVLVPLKEGDKYNQAFSDAGDRLIAVLTGEPDPGPPEVKDTLNVERTFKKAEETDTGNATIWVVGLLLAATVIPMVTYFFYQGFSG